MYEVVSIYRKVEVDDIGAYVLDISWPLSLF